MDSPKLEISGLIDIWGIQIEIGETNVIAALEQTFGRNEPDVQVWLGVEAIANGALWTYEGFGGTDVTAAESPTIEVGDIDLVERLRDLDGREVVLIVELAK